MLHEITQMFPIKMFTVNGLNVIQKMLNLLVPLHISLEKPICPVGLFPHREQYNEGEGANSIVAPNCAGQRSCLFWRPGALGPLQKHLWFATMPGIMHYILAWDTFLLKGSTRVGK